MIKDLLHHRVLDLFVRKQYEIIAGLLRMITGKILHIHPRNNSVNLVRRQFVELHD